LKKTIKQFNRYALIGVFSTLINYSIYNLLFFFTKLIVFSAAIAYIAGIINSYIFGKKWVFKQREGRHNKTFYKFIFVYFIGGLLNSLTIFFLDKLQFQYILLWFIGNGLAVMNNFLGSKFFVFKN